VVREGLHECYRGEEILLGIDRGEVGE